MEVFTEGAMALSVCRIEWSWWEYYAAPSQVQGIWRHGISQNIGRWGVGNHTLSEDRHRWRYLSQFLQFTRESDPTPLGQDE